MGSESQSKGRAATGSFAASRYDGPVEPSETSDAIPRMRSRSLRRIVYKYAVALALAAFFIAFSILLPSTFFTFGNVRTIVSSQAVLMILALGLTVPLTTGEFDLSIGSMLGCAAVLTAFFTGELHWPLLFVIVGVLLVGALAGATNGLLVVRIGINAFIGTLGVSTILTGVTLAVSDGQTSQHRRRAARRFRPTPGPWASAPGVSRLRSRDRALVRLRTHATWPGLVLRRRRARGRTAGGAEGRSTALRRFCRFGRDQRRRRNRHRWPTGRGGSVGRTEFSPAGLRRGVPWRDDHQARTLHAWGTVVALYLLVTGVTGLELLGSSSWVQEMFNGVALLIAVTFARFVALDQVL